MVDQGRQEWPEKFSYILSQIDYLSLNKGSKDKDFQ